MEIKDMQSFYAVVEEGNISHAALRLNVAQPALSRQMKHLEESLGVKLFERGSRRIRLTEAGRVLYERITNILGLVESTVSEIHEIAGGTAGTIKLGTIVSSGASLLPALMIDFNRRYPKVLFQIWEGEGTRVLNMLDSRLIDLAITRTKPTLNLYASIVLENEPLVVIMRHDSDLAQAEGDSICMKDLRDHAIIIPLRWQATFQTHCCKLGFEPYLVCVSDSIVQNLLNVRTGLGVALLPASALSLLDSSDLTFKHLTAPEIQTHTVISWRKDHILPTATQRFLELLRERLHIPG